MADKCCTDEGKAKACREKAEQFAARLVATWEKSFGRGSNKSDDNVGGYLCWDWTDAYLRANPAGTVILWGKRKKIRKKEDKTRWHFFARFCACTCDEKNKLECCVDVDDGWFQAGEFIHDPKDDWYKKSGVWEDAPDTSGVGKRLQKIPIVTDCEGC